MSRFVDWRTLWVSLYLLLGASCLLAVVLFASLGQNSWGPVSAAAVGLLAPFLCALLLAAVQDSGYRRELAASGTFVGITFALLFLFAEGLGDEVPALTLVGWAIGWVLGFLSVIFVSKAWPGCVFRRVPEEQESTLGLLTMVFAMLSFAGAYFVHAGVFALLFVLPVSIFGETQAVLAVGIVSSVIFIVISPSLVGFALQSALPREADAGILRALLFPGVLGALVAFREEGIALAFGVFFSASISALLVGLMMLPGLRVAKDRSAWKARSRAGELLPSVRVVSK